MGAFGCLLSTLGCAREPPMGRPSLHPDGIVGMGADVMNSQIRSQDSLSTTGSMPLPRREQQVREGSSLTIWEFFITLSQMRWSPAGAYYLVLVRAELLNDALLEGERLFAHAEDILRAVEMAELDLRAAGKQPRGVIEIACFPSFAKARLLPAIVRARARFPDLRVMIHELEMPDALNAVRDGRWSRWALPTTWCRCLISVVSCRIRFWTTLCSWLCLNHGGACTAGSA
jgi:hypothetical protein